MSEIRIVGLEFFTNPVNYWNVKLHFPPHDWKNIAVHNKPGTVNSIFQGLKKEYKLYKE